MHRLFLFLFLSCAAPASTPIGVPLAFEQRAPDLFVARAGNTSFRFQPAAVRIDDVTLRFGDAQSDARLEGLGTPVPATYLGASWRRSFPQFPRIAIRGLYPGVDAIFYEHDGRLEYDLAIAPGALAIPLRLQFEHARRVTLSADGSLVIQTASGEIRQLPPKVRQGERSIAARYRLRNANEVALQLGRYDRRRPLTIDPVVVYAKYFSGSKSDIANFVTTDPQGNVYITGYTNSPDFLAAEGASVVLTPPLVALTNSGQSVTPLPVSLESSTSAIGGTPDGKIVYVAAGNNIYYSSDSGAHWTLTGPLPVPIFTPSAGPAVISAVSVDAIDPSRAYVATNQGIYSTADNGQDWFPRDYGLAGNFESAVQAASVVVSPADHTLLFATTGQPNFLYKSTDAAGTWQQLTPLYPGEQPAGPFPSTQIRVTLAPNGTDVYVINNNGNLLKSSDRGATWQKIGGSLFGAKVLRIDPLNPSNLYVVDNFGVQRSADGGASFSTANPPGVSSGVVPDALAYEPASATLYVATSGSVWASTDQGTTWKITPLSLLQIHFLETIGGRVLGGVTTPSTTYVAKLDPNGPRLLYSTFFTGSPIVGVTALKADAQGSAYLAGNTLSQSLTGARQLSPPAPPNFSTIYVAKLQPDGTSLAFLDTIGGSKGGFVQGMALDSSGAIYLTGATGSPDFPTSANAAQPKPPSTPCPRTTRLSPFEIINFSQYAFATKIAPDGASLAYSTFVGGSCGSIGAAIAVNGAGEAYVGGSTTSPDLAGTSGGFQSAFPGPQNSNGYPDTLSAGFAAHLSAAGDRILGATYIGGGYVSNVAAIALDSSGSPLLSGSTWGIATGATPGAYQKAVVYKCAEPISIGPSIPPSNGADAFLLKLDPALSKAGFLTYLGGSCYDTGTSLALDPAGNPWLSGNTNSGDFPLADPFSAKAPTSGFVSELSPDGSKLLFSSFAEVSSMAVDSRGSVYLAGYTTTPPTAKPAGTTAAVLTRIDPAQAPPVEIDNITPVALATNGTLPSIALASVVAPGELLRIQGHNLGPADKVNSQLDSSGRLPFDVAGTRVMFGSYAAPLISVQESEIVCFVPFAVSGTTVVTVQASAGNSNAVRIAAAASAPQILEILNQDSTVNSASNPAAIGSVLTVYVSGLGQTNPPSVDGQVNAAPAAVPLASLTVFAAGQQVKPQFVGAAVGLIAGIAQVNVQVPTSNYFQGQGFLSIGQGGAVFYVK